MTGNDTNHGLLSSRADLTHHLAHHSGGGLRGLRGGAGGDEGGLYRGVDWLLQLGEDVGHQAGGVDSSAAHSHSPGQAGSSQACQRQQAEYLQL